MHELSITHSMLRQVIDAATAQRARRVERVNLLVGEDAGVVLDCVCFYFERLAQGTVAEGAGLSFRTVPLRIRCPSCGGEFSRVEDLCDCNAGAEVVAGGDLVVESIDVEDA